MSKEVKLTKLQMIVYLLLLPRTNYQPLTNQQLADTIGVSAELCGYLKETPTQNNIQRITRDLKNVGIKVCTSGQHKGAGLFIGTKPEDVKRTLQDYSRKVMGMLDSMKKLEDWDNPPEIKIPENVERMVNKTRALVKYEPSR